MSGKANQMLLEESIDTFMHIYEYKYNMIISPNAGYNGKNVYPNNQARCSKLCDYHNTIHVHLRHPVWALQIMVWTKCSTRPWIMVWAKCSTRPWIISCWSSLKVQVQIGDPTLHIIFQSSL